MKLLKTILVTCIVALPSWFTLSQSIALVGGEVHTMGSKGIVENATILIKDGKIESVIADGKVPDNYETTNIAGKTVTPGLIGAFTSLGLVEVESSAGVVDSRVNSHNISSTGAAYNVEYALNADSSLIPISRIEGFTSAASSISYTGQLFLGQGAMVSLNSEYNMLHKSKAFITVDVTESGAGNNGGSRSALWVALYAALGEAVSTNLRDLQATSNWQGVNSRADVVALKPIVRGEVPLLVKANRAADIIQALALKKQFPQIDLVLVNVLEGWRVAEQIAAQSVPVILNPEYNLPGGFDQLGATMKNAARLHAAGVMVAIGMETHNIRLATQHAGNAVANGLPHEAGIAALSSNVAKIFGIDAILGSLDVGKQADLVVWSGDPLQVTQSAEIVIVKGKPMEMSSRQTKLRDRYLNRDLLKPASYTRPQ